MEWCKLQSPTSGSAEQPGAREMHSSCSFGDTIVVCGGRNEQGILADTWLLRGAYQNNTVSLTWHRTPQLDLPVGRCSHSMTVVGQSSDSSLNNNINVTTKQYTMYIFGGFAADASISCELIRHVYNPPVTADGGLHSSSSVGNINVENKDDSCWQVMRYPTKIQERFGSCLCEAPKWYMDALISKPSSTGRCAFVCLFFVYVRAFLY